MVGKGMEWTRRMRKVGGTWGMKGSGMDPEDERSGTNVGDEGEWEESGG